MSMSRQARISSNDIINLHSIGRNDCRVTHLQANIRDYHDYCTACRQVYARARAAGARRVRLPAAAHGADDGGAAAARARRRGCCGAIRGAADRRQGRRLPPRPPECAAAGPVARQRAFSDRSRPRTARRNFSSNVTVPGCATAPRLRALRPRRLVQAIGLASHGDNCLAFRLLAPRCIARTTLRSCSPPACPSLHGVAGASTVKRT
jgi:hypothetical protein